MNVVVVNEFGGPSKLEVVDFETPTPGIDEVLVKVDSIGVCGHDLLYRAGRLPGALAGQVLGHELAGTVVEVGDRVTNVDVDQRVAVYHKPMCGTCRACLGGRTDACTGRPRGQLYATGAYAEFVSVPARNVVALPKETDSDTGAILMCPIGAGFRALRVAGARPDDTLLVVGANGGMGVHQIQVAHRSGMRVIAVTRHAEHAEDLERLGADHVFVTRNSEFARDVRELAGERGIDIVLDNVVSSTFDQSLRSLRAGGRLGLLGNVEVSPVSLDPGRIIYRRLSIFGTGAPTYEDALAATEFVGRHSIGAVVAHHFALSEASKAHEVAERGGLLGRVILHPSQ